MLAQKTIRAARTARATPTVLGMQNAHAMKATWVTHAPMQSLPHALVLGGPGTLVLILVEQHAAKVWRLRRMPSLGILKAFSTLLVQMARQLGLAGLLTARREHNLA